MIINITDAIMVGHLGHLSLASASLMISIISIPSFTCIGLTYLISSLVAEKRGEGNNSECGQIFFNASISIFVLTVFIAIVLNLGFSVVYNFGQDPNVVAAGYGFFNWLSWSLIPMILFISIKQFYDGLEFTFVPMLISGISVIINLFLNYVFIYGSIGIEPHGLEGSGIASFITRCIMFLLLAFHLFFNPKLKSFGITKINLSIQRIKFFLKLSLPSSWQFTSEVAAFSCLAILAGWYGSIPQAAHQIAITVAAFSYVIFIGLSTASSIKIGESFGRKNFKEIKAHGKDSIKLALTLATITALLFIILNKDIAKLFNQEQEVISIASTLLIFAAAFQFSDALQALGVGMLRGLQDVRIPTVYTTISYWIIGIPSGYILAEYLGWKVYGIWIGFIICLSVSAFLLLYRFFKIVRIHPLTENS